LVTKVHLEAIRFAREGYTILLIGHEGHDEVLGTMGEAPEHIRLVQDAGEVGRLDLPPGARVAYLTQTTLSVDDAERIVRALRKRFPHIVGPSRDDICYATQNRQEAVKELVPEADAVIVLGSQNSSNSRRLAELAHAHGKPAYLVDRVDEIPPGAFRGPETVLITAGASASEEGFQYELIDGRLYASPKADLPQDRVDHWINVKLFNYALEHPEVINFVYGKARVFVPGRSGITVPQPDCSAYRDFPLGQ